MNTRFVVLRIAIALNLCLMALPGFGSGTLVLVGGNLSDDNAVIYDKFIALAGGNSARIGVVTAASKSHYEKNQQSYLNLFANRGIDAQWIEIHIHKPDAAQNPEILKQIQPLTGIFFGGGDQSLLKRLFTDSSGKDTKVLSLIREKYKLGMAIAGISAGAVILSGLPHAMITGGGSHKSLLTSAVPRSENTEPGRLTYNPQSGFGWFPYGILDTHFSERKRYGRLIRLAADTGSRFGFGIDENTSLVVEENKLGESVMTVYGANGVYVIDLLNAETDIDFMGNWRITQVKSHYLKHGDEFDPKTGVASLHSALNPDLTVFSSVIDFEENRPYKIIQSRNGDTVISTSGAFINAAVKIFRQSTGKQGQR